MEITKELSRLQQKLHAPKSQFNKFGGYHYRSCEDILQAVKPLLGEATITVNDDIVVIGDRIYVKSTAEYRLGNESIKTSAFAREPVTSKGMSDAQVTGSTSSYARKYALNGLLLIDDNKDPDTQDNSEPRQKQAATPKPHPNSKEAQAAKREAAELHPVFPIIAGYMLNEEEWPFVKEAMEEMTRKEQIEIFNLCNMHQKQIIRDLKIKGGAE